MARTRGPAVVGRLVLADPVGVGGTGTVWRAWDLRDGRFVAAKLLRAYDEALLLRFVREQAVRISHPHVLAPHGWAAEDDVAVIVTDLMRGGSVRDLARTTGPLPAALVVALLDQALQALVAVHAAGVVHGDVKPANLLLEPTGRGRPHLRLADFGVATGHADAVVFTGSGPVGTPGYLAPEQLAGAPPDPAQDLFALGVTGRRLLARAAPVSTLLDSMARPEARLRPTAATALERLRSLPAPRDGPWPAVPDRLGPDPAPPPRRGWRGQAG